MEPEAPAVPPSKVATMGELIDAYLEAEGEVERMKPVFNRASNRHTSAEAALTGCLRDLGPVVHDGWVYYVNRSPSSGNPAVIRKPLVESTTPIPKGAMCLPDRVIPSPLT